jgi:hypothetical protein
MKRQWEVEFAKSHKPVTQVNQLKLFFFEERASFILAIVLPLSRPKPHGCAAALTEEGQWLIHTAYFRAAGPWENRAKPFYTAWPCPLG